MFLLILNFHLTAIFFRQSIFSCYDKYTGFGNAASPVVPSVIHANIPFWSSKAK